MPNIAVDFTKNIGPIKPMHAVGQPPFTGKFHGFDFSHMEHLKKAHIPFSRLHDVNGPFGGNRFVDIPNIFRNFDADPDNPDSYDFVFTDLLIKEMLNYGLEPIFRLGVTIENQCNIKAYHIHPPKDFDKWARICEHIVMHYNEGWANGFNSNITYWEIWNEPENGLNDGNQMWTGTAEEYYRLYDITAKRLKNHFGDSIKVGGYASSGFRALITDPEKYGLNVPARPLGHIQQIITNYRLNFFYDFFDYLKEHNTPIDFFSWHSYQPVEENVAMADYIDRYLTEKGFGNIEVHLNEWNPAFRREDRCSSLSSSSVAAVMCAMQNTRTDMLCYYDARIGISGYAGMFNPITFLPCATYYSIAAFGELYNLGNQANCKCDEGSVYAVAAFKNDAQAVLITNHNSEDKQISLNLKGDFKVFLIDADHFLTATDLDANNFTLRAEQVALIKNY